jgi:hypothetical protein
MFTSATYITYILVSIFITIFVSRTLSKNGEIFLIDGFGGNVDLAKSVNHLLVVGFYLLNLGFVLLRMRTNVSISDIEGMIVYLSSGLGFVLLVLGIAHFFNMFVIHKFRDGYIRKNTVTPVNRTANTSA